MELQDFPGSVEETPLQDKIANGSSMTYGAESAGNDTKAPHEPLLNSSTQQAKSKEPGSMKRIKLCLTSINWKSLIATIFLMAAVAVCNAAFSIMAPFFPEEVSFLCMMCKSMRR